MALDRSCLRDRRDSGSSARLNETLDAANADFDKYEFGEAAKNIYNFAWNDFASWYVEMAKLTASAPQTKAVLLVTSCRRSSGRSIPCMPFVTEEIWQKLPHEGTSIMRAPMARRGRFVLPRSGRPFRASST
ncbi:MAG: class I tRNA ligase family protein [Bacillus subtilis]|nr:class I tRNA ligase family protein [Bacillus subtilis]